MHTERSTWPEKLAYAARLGMLVLAGVVVIGGFSGSKDGGAPNLGRVFATGRNSAAPGYLSLTLKPSPNSKFYIVDTTREIICVYNLDNNDELRLVSARKFDRDRGILDGSIKVHPANKSLEDLNGATYEQSDAYLKASSSVLEAEKKKFGP